MKKKHILWGVGILIVVIVVVLLTQNKNQKVDFAGKEISIPKGGVHWHPILTIIIDNKQIPIPDDIGYGSGKIIDTHLSGMRMSPTHTHESDGTIHIENNNPSSKPETITLGYFFEVWNKEFTSTCVFEYCTDKGELKMRVNGVENVEFGNYVMGDKDNIVIEYKTNRGS